MAERQTDPTVLEPDIAFPALSRIAAQAAQHHLMILGGFTCEAEASLPTETRTVLLLGPAEPGFWPHLTAQPEWSGSADPVDRWSRRVIEKLACDLGAEALFPFGPPPYHPFHQWALRTGRIWESPVRLLVHETQGLMVSFRGALALKDQIHLPDPPQTPCNDCDKPCLAACPAGALGPAGYDVPSCHGHLDTAAGSNCMQDGCAVRRACPLSQTYARLPEQSAYHMGQFHR